jgi:aminoglycoside phosphotransferase (APT) family kinase protein
MDEQRLEPGLPLETQCISGGRQNEIYDVRRGALHAALRKPPMTAPEARDAGLAREWRIVTAMRDTGTPHARAIAICTDPSVLGRAFYLTEFVDGWSPMSQEGWPSPFDLDIAARAGLAFQLVDGVVRMGELDWRGAGLADLGRPDGFHDRQVERWSRHHERVGGRDLTGLDVATSWLADRRPLDYVPGLMHGDYQFANVMFGHGAPARLVAVIDWEMATIGDPKLDLAWAIEGWPDESTREACSLAYVDITGMPSRSALLEHYCTASGRQIDDFDYYLVLARWKLAIVLEAGYQRAGEDPKLRDFGNAAEELMQRAAHLARLSGYPRHGAVLRTID